jgi:MFS transporter, DHA2 family, multidrug resistance protein
MIATVMQALDATIANVALPQLQESLGGGIDLGSWVMTSYLCASAVVATLTGWLRRRYGAWPVFASSIILFVIASLLCSIAPSGGTLIQFRLLQGAAAGIIQPLAQAILLDIYPKQDHGRMLALWGATIMVGPIVGPIFGGIITELASWRWIFALNVPLGLIAIWGLRRLPIPEGLTARPRFDFIGLTLLVLGIGSLQLTLQRSIGQTWPFSNEIIIEAAAAVLALAAIAVRSGRSQLTLLKIQVFRNRNFAMSAFYNYMVGALLFTTIVFLPALSEGPLGYDATQAGLVLSPRGIGTMTTMLFVSRFIDRVDNRVLLTAGLLITAGALAVISRTPTDCGEIWLLFANAMQGIGVGLLFTPLSALAFATLPSELRSDAAGVYNLVRQLGCATGVAIMTAVLQAQVQAGLIRIPGQAQSDTSSQIVDGVTFTAYSGCFRTMAIVTILILPGVLLFRVLRHDQVTVPSKVV